MDDVRRKLEQLLRERGQLAKKQAQIDEQLRELEEMYHAGLAMIRANPGPAVPARVRRALQAEQKARTIRTMDVDTTGQSAALKRGVARATRKHPAQRKLYEAGVTLTEVAKELGEGRPRVSSWFAEGEANRAIPRAKAEQLLAKYGIPLSDWARIKD